MKARIEGRKVTLFTSLGVQVSVFKMPLRDASRNIAGVVIRGVSAQSTMKNDTVHYIKIVKPSTFAVVTGVKSLRSYGLPCPLPGFAHHAHIYYAPYFNRISIVLSPPHRSKQRFVHTSLEMIKW